MVEASVQRIGDRVRINVQLIEAATDEHLWAELYDRSVADVFGMRNNFDLAAVDRNDGSLVVEVKWLQLKPNKGPNGEFQRFIGQCGLAAAANDVVIGVCGLWGRRERQLDAHETLLIGALRKIGVRLIVLRAES